MARLVLPSLLEPLGLSWTCYAAVSSRDWTQSHALGGALEPPQRDSQAPSRQWVFVGGAGFTLQ